MRTLWNSLPRVDQDLLKFCNDIEKEGQDWIAAAECYEAFAENYPMSEFADKALSTEEKR